ncbi:MAG: HEPN domain-containing protein [Magnetococcales bacterium]|nr:HEPN domain-containing protein [Magnetococcales bacterium]
MNGIDHAQDLLRLARSDLKAMTGMCDPDVFSEAIFGFHSQQAVEKGIKAWLAALEVLFPLTHDLSRLLLLLEKQGVNMTELWDWVELTPFAVEHRYTWMPDEEYPLDRNDLINRINRLLNHIGDQIQRTNP